MAVTRNEEAVIPALERIRQLSRLERDWDSYGGDPPTPKAIGRAERVVRDVTEAAGHAAIRRTEPRVVVARGDGGIILEWNTPDVALEVHVEPDGHLAYLLEESADGEPRYTERDDATWLEIQKLLLDIVAS